MPELPEVEVTRRGIAPHAEGRRIISAMVRNPGLRWPVPPDLREKLAGQSIGNVSRRAKYLLFGTGKGTLIVHLGMSGSLRLLPAAAAPPPGKHDHVDLILDNGVGPSLQGSAPFWRHALGNRRRHASSAIGSIGTRAAHRKLQRQCAV